MNEEISQIKKSTTYLTEIETLAQDILTDKQMKLQLSNGQNKYREAYRALQQSVDKKTWMKLSSVYIELPTEECKSIVKNGEILLLTFILIQCVCKYAKYEI